MSEEQTNTSSLETSENEARNPAPGEVKAPPATVAVDVPVEHVDLIKRAVALLERGEQWVADNIHAGISHFEGIFNISDDAKPADVEDEQGK